MITPGHMAALRVSHATRRGSHRDVTRRIRYILLGCAIVLVLAIGAGVWRIHSVVENAQDAYAVEWVAGTIIEYMDTHDGAWPASWDDFRETYASRVKRDGLVSNFDGLRSSVEV
ncbi:unnamed protein product, partial [marine sediment metagenome]